MLPMANPQVEFDTAYFDAHGALDSTRAALARRLAALESSVRIAFLRATSLWRDRDSRWFVRICVSSCVVRVCA